jgi:hypothetical protein
MSKMIIDEYGNKTWYTNGLLHREGGPALEYADGGKEWWQDGKRHRLNGPAVEWADGTKKWIQNGLLHREDGPAVEFENGSICWYLDGKFYSKECWFEILPDDSKMKVLFDESFIRNR